MSLPGMKTIIDSLHDNRITFDVYNNVRIEPTDKRYLLLVVVVVVVVVARGLVD